jgi:hypothetical protein
LWKDGKEPKRRRNVSEGGRKEGRWNRDGGCREEATCMKVSSQYQTHEGSERCD